MISVSGLLGLAYPIAARTDVNEMFLLNEALARERMREHERLVAGVRERQVVSRLAAARRWQRRAEQASRRARALLTSM